MKRLYQYHESFNKTDETIVCLAGASEGCFRFYKSLPILRKYFNVILFNNPGVDGAPDEYFYSPEDLAEKFSSVLDHLGINEYYLLGHSMGSFVSQRMAINHPERIKKLVLIGSSLGSFKSIETFEHLRFKEKLSRIEDYTFPKKFQENNPDFIKNYLLEKKERYRLPKKTVFADFLCGAWHSTIGETIKISMPTLIIQGTADKLTPKEAAISLAKSLPHCRLMLMENMGHNPFDEDVSIMEDVADFIYDKAEVGVKFDMVEHPKEELERDKEFRNIRKSMDFLVRLKNYFAFDEIMPELEKFAKNHSVNIEKNTYEC